VIKARERSQDDVRAASKPPRGIQVAFAFEYDEADDMLENLIRKHSSPKHLTVVSSDNRIRKCAMARRAISVDSDTFLNRLEQLLRRWEAEVDQDANGDSFALTESEVQEWLREFGEDAGR